MWQRPQTLYFAIATVLAFILIFCNIATIFVEGETEQVKFISKIPYAVLGIISALGCLVCTVSWGHRNLQMRVGVATCVILLGLQVWLVADYFSAPEQLIFSPLAMFPIVSMFFCAIALRGVYLDELLVQSSKHLRSARAKSRPKEKEIKFIK